MARPSENSEKNLSLEEIRPTFNRQLFNDVADAVHSLERGKYSFSEDEEEQTEEEKEKIFNLISSANIQDKDILAAHNHDIKELKNVSSL